VTLAKLNGAAAQERLVYVDWWCGLCDANEKRYGKNG